MVYQFAIDTMQVGPASMDTFAPPRAPSVEAVEAAADEGEEGAREPLITGEVGRLETGRGRG